MYSESEPCRCFLEEGREGGLRQVPLFKEPLGTKEGQSAQGWPVAGHMVGGYSSHWVSGQKAQWTWSTLPVDAGDTEGTVCGHGHGLERAFPARGAWAQKGCGSSFDVDDSSPMWHEGSRVPREALVSHESNHGPGST